MTDREKIINAFENCVFNHCDDNCMYRDEEWKDKGFSACRHFSQENIVEIPKRVLLDVLELIKSQQPVNEWVSVKDRLPNENEDVMLMFPMNMAVGFLKDSKWFVNSGCNWSTEVIEDDGDEPPLFWMPLSQPPKEV